MLRLVTIPFSHYCEKARWALDRSGVPYREDGYLPLLHYVPARLAGGGRTVPVLVTPDGALGDSSDILAYLDTRTPPARALYPSDPAARGAVTELEDLFDEKLGPATRRLAYFHLLGARERSLRWLSRERGPLGRAAVAGFFPVLGRLLTRGLNITPAAAERSLERTRGLFAQVAERLADGRPFLAGDTFTAADLTFAALAVPVLLPRETGRFVPQLEDAPDGLAALVRELRETPAGAFALRLYRAHRA